MFVLRCCSVRCSALCCRGVSTLILGTAAMFALRFLAFLAVHCVAESQHSDPLTQLPCCFALLQRPLQCTVLQRSQHSDPLTAARVCAFAALLLRALCCRGVSILIL
jgi:hypothetical protein